MDTTHTVNQDRYLATLQRLLEISAADLRTALTHASNALADALRADKVDAFLYDESRDSLVALGVSTQPLSNLQKSLGLDVLPVSNGGRSVQVYKTGETFRSGRLLDDAEELRGVKEGLKVQSEVGIPLEVGGQRRGMLMIASQKPDFFSDADVAFTASAARWVGVIAEHSELTESIKRNALEQGRRTRAEELITVLAHDLRNYLSPVTLRLYKLRSRAQTERRSGDTDDAEAALSGLARLGGLISDLLDTARLDGGAFQINAQPLDIAAVFSDAAAVLSSGEHPIIVNTSAAMIVSGDAARLRQCVDNLLANAVTHSPANAPVDVFISEEHSKGQLWARIEIVDEGPGIPDAMLPYVFDLFVTGRQERGGTGLGLYIAKRIASAHGGDLTADRYPGRGARFTLKLPAIGRAEQ
jgi:two-component system, OmpR family, sensor kinase